MFDFSLVINWISVRPCVHRSDRRRPLIKFAVWLEDCKACACRCFNVTKHIVQICFTLLQYASNASHCPNMLQCSISWVLPSERLTGFMIGPRTDNCHTHVSGKKCNYTFEFNKPDLCQIYYMSPDQIKLPNLGGIPSSWDRLNQMKRLSYYSCQTKYILNL